MDLVSNDPIYSQDDDEYSSDEEEYDDDEEQPQHMPAQPQPQQHQPQQPQQLPWQAGNPYGSTVVRKHKTQGFKKERIKRQGLFPLNMTRNYTLKSEWGAQEGFRELIQNL